MFFHCHCCLTTSSEPSLNIDYTISSTETMKVEIVFVLETGMPG